MDQEKKKFKAAFERAGAFARANGLLEPCKNPEHSHKGDNVTISDEGEMLWQVLSRFMPIWEMAEVVTDRLEEDFREKLKIAKRSRDN